MIFKHFLVLATILMSHAAFGQGEDSPEASNQPFTANETHALGIAAGPTLGLGVAYRWTQDDNWAYRFSLLPYATKPDGLLAGGISTIYTLNRQSFGSIYISFGVAGFAQWETKKNDLGENVRKSQTGLAFGPGLGLELSSELRFFIEIPTPVIFMDGEFYGVLPIPNIGVLFPW